MWKVNGRRTTDPKWWQKLTLPLARRAKNHSFACSCSKNLSSFWLIIKQQWTIEEISISINSNHLELREQLSYTIFRGGHIRTIPANFGLIQFSSFRGEDLMWSFIKICLTGINWLKERRRFKCESLWLMLDGWTDAWQKSSDQKRSPGHWPGELKSKAQIFTNNSIAAVNDC